MDERGKRRSDVIRLKVITPEEEFFSGEAESIILRTVEGYLGFLPGRAPACVLLHDEGRLRFRQPGSQEFTLIYMEGGFAFMDGDMTVYTDSAYWPVREEDYPPEVLQVREAMGAGAELARQAQEVQALRRNPPKLQPDTRPRE